MEAKLAEKLKNNIIKIIWMAIGIFCMVAPVVRATSPSRVECDSYVLDENWKINVREEPAKRVKLSEYVFDICNKGDKIVLETIIPDSAAGISSPIINFYSVHSTVDFYVDEIKTYSYGWDLYEKGELLGYGNHFIDLPEDYAGKNIRLELTVTENSAFDGIQALTIEDGNTFIMKDLSNKRASLVISCFLVMFGVILMCISLLMIKENKSFTQTFCIAMFSFLIGGWSMCNTDLIAYMTTDLRVKVYMEYMTLYVIPVPLVYYFKNKVYDKNTNNIYKGVFWFLISISTIYIAVAFIGQYLNVIHFPVMLSILHVIIMLDMIFVLVLNIRDIIEKRKRKHREINTVMLGLGISLFMIFAELVRFNMSKFFTGFSKNSYNSTISWAILVIVIALMLDFCQNVSRNLYKDAKQKMLKRMAYMDDLTGLANRRACEEEIASIASNGDAFAVVSLDLNHLKEANDNHGHEAGDDMLKTFANILLETFDEVGTVGRIGGDEYMVIIPQFSAYEVKSFIAKMENLIKKVNTKNSNYSISTAYGIADSSEVASEADPHSVYRLADARMYENKRKTDHGKVKP